MELTQSSEVYAPRKAKRGRVVWWPLVIATWLLALVSITYIAGAQMYGDYFLQPLPWDNFDYETTSQGRGDLISISTYLMPVIYLATIVFVTSRWVRQSPQKRSPTGQSNYGLWQALPLAAVSIAITALMYHYLTGAVEPPHLEGAWQVDLSMLIPGFLIWGGIAWAVLVGREGNLPTLRQGSIWMAAWVMLTLAQYANSILIGFTFTVFFSNITTCCMGGGVF